MPYNKYSSKQKSLAAMSGNPKKIEASDLKILRTGNSKKKKKK